MKLALTATALALALAALPRPAAAVTPADITVFRLYRGTDTKTAVLLGSTDYLTKFSKALCDCNTQAYAVEVALTPGLVTTGLSRVEIWAGTSCNMPMDATRLSHCKLLNMQDVKLYANPPPRVSIMPQDFLVGPATDTMSGLPDPCPPATATPTLSVLIIDTNNAVAAERNDIQISYLGAMIDAPMGLTAAGGGQKVHLSWMENNAVQIAAGGGFQIFCATADGQPVFNTFQPVYTVPCSAPDPGIFGKRDATFLCSDRFPDNSREGTVSGLDNGVAYQFGVIAFDKVGNPSPISTLVTGTPVSTIDEYEYYRDYGGNATGGFCAAAPGGRGTTRAGLGFALALALVAWNRRRRVS